MTCENEEGSPYTKVTTRRVRRRLAKTFQRIIQRKKGVQLERFGAAEKLGSGRKLLKVLVGADVLTKKIVIR